MVVLAVLSRVKDFMKRPVPWGAVFVTYIAIVAGVFYASYVSQRADSEILKSRIGSVTASCASQNDAKKPLSRLVDISLSVPDQPERPGVDQDKIRADFERERVNLQSYDCKTQRELLHRYLRPPNFDVSIPYCVTYKGYQVGDDKCPPPPPVKPVKQMKVPASNQGQQGIQGQQGVQGRQGVQGVKGNSG